MTHDEILRMALKSLLRDEEAVCSLTAEELGQVCDRLRRVERGLGTQLDVKGVFTSMEMDCSMSGHWRGSITFLIVDPFDSELRIEMFLTKEACEELDAQYHASLYDSPPELIDLSLDVRGWNRGTDRHDVFGGSPTRVTANRRMELFGVTLVDPPAGWHSIQINGYGRGRL